MAFVCICLFLMLGTSAALPQDLSRKMFIFPQQTNTAHVRLTTSKQSLGAVTVCLRSFTDFVIEHPLFSLATPSIDNGFLIFKTSGNLEVYVRNNNIAFTGLDYKLNEWQSICATWDAASGLVQLWINGKPSSIKYINTSNISGPILIVLGQEQDNLGGGFDIKQCFVGMMTDVHMWDYVLSPCQIQGYSNKSTYPEGNVLRWKSLEFEAVGNVLIKNNQEQC